MNWTHWHQLYDVDPTLQARLRIVCRQIGDALDECPAGPITVVSACSGDGRDLLSVLANHARRRDVRGALLDTNAEALARGQAVADNLGLAVHFIEADATQTRSYRDWVPADLFIFSGIMGHLRFDDVRRLIASFPMFCKTGGCLIWNRGLTRYGGGEQVPVYRELFRQAGFEERHFETTATAGFACVRTRFAGATLPFDADRVLFEFVGLERIGAEYRSKI